MAAAAATAAALLLGLWFERPGGRRALVRLSCFTVGFIVPPAVAFFCLASAMPRIRLGSACSDRGSWQSDLTFGICHAIAPVEDEPPWENLSAYALDDRPLCDRTRAGRSRWVGAATAGQYRMVIAVIAFVVTAVLNDLSAWIDWFGLAQPLPLLIFLTILAITVCFWPHRHEEATSGAIHARDFALDFRPGPAGQDNPQPPEATLRFPDQSSIARWRIDGAHPAARRR